MSSAHTWGTTPTERKLSFPCDKLADDGCNCVCYRGITINAPAAIIYKWLCQMRVAPYSYDWIDNLGRRSPRTLTTGLDDLTQNMPILLGAFEIVGFEHDKSITLSAIRQHAGWMGMSNCVITYMIVPQSEPKCRLLVKIALSCHRNVIGLVMRWLMPWADLIMMRKQLLNFKALAEKTADEEV